jgi:L-ribulose-5-phosphate 3-epimerase
MQGRLLPPEPGRFQAFPPDRWQEELALAARAGVSGVEFIYEVYGEDRNPLATDAGATELRRAGADSGVAVESLCADWFMDRPLVDEGGAADPAAVAKLEELLGRADAAGICRIVVPFIDTAALATGAAVAQAARILAEAAAEAAGAELHVESSLPPAELGAMVRDIDSPRVRINYDTGNSASLGYDHEEEFACYGELVGSVHVKDRVRGGGTVPLGEGDADLPGVFARLAERRWDRPLVLQIARALNGDEVAWTRANVARVRELWAAAA